MPVPRMLMELPAETDTVAFPVHTVWFEFAGIEHVSDVAVQTPPEMVPTVAVWVAALGLPLIVMVSPVSVVAVPTSRPLAVLELDPAEVPLIRR